MTSDHIIEIMLAAIATIVAYASYRLASKTTQGQEKASMTAVDAAAFVRAKEIYESAMDTLREDLKETRADLVTAHHDLTSAHHELTSARHEIAALRSEIAALKKQINGFMSPP